MRIGWIWLAFLFWNFVPAETLGQDTIRFEFSQPKMGTLFRLVLYTSNEKKAKDFADKAFARVDSLNRIFSDYDETSEVSRLGTLGTPGKAIPVSPELRDVLKFALRLSKKTKGAFDVTIGPLSKLWRRAFRRHEFPELSRIEAARSTVNFKFLKLSYRRSAVKIRQRGIKLDFGGIAKGYAVDEMSRILQEEGVRSYLVDGGGDIFARGAPPGQKGWKVGLPSGESLILIDRAIAVSGDHYRYLEWNNKRYSHIIDPRTGLGTTSRTSVGVLAENCMKADAWASAITVLGKTESESVIRNQGIEVYYFQNE